MSVLLYNSFAKPITNINYNDICDTLYFFIAKNCKNIEKYHNNIPQHFDNDKILHYSYIVKNGTLGFISQTNYIKISYNKNQNKIFNTVSKNTVIQNINTFFQNNNIFNNFKIASINDIIKCCFVSLEFIKQNIIRVYFPLSDSYCYFYKGDEQILVKNIPTINLSTEQHIEKTFKNFLSYLTGCTVKKKSDGTETVTKENILYSFLYTITAGAVSFNTLNAGSGSDGDGDFKTGDIYKNFHITLN